MKNYGVNPQRAAYGWTSNNSVCSVHPIPCHRDTTCTLLPNRALTRMQQPQVLAHIGMDYDDICKRIAINGEPGIAWLDNMQAFSRMDGVVVRLGLFLS